MQDKETTKRNILIFLIVVPFVSSGAFVVLGAILFLFDPKGATLGDWIFVLSSLAVFVLFSYFYYLFKNQYKMKYSFLGRKYKTLIKKSLQKFDGADETFKKDYVKWCKDNYKKSGKIEYVDPIYGNAYFHNFYLYKEKKNVLRLKNILLLLKDCVRSRKGFLEFFERLQGADTESPYSAYEYLQVEMLPTEFRYLIQRVYAETSFNLCDVGLSKTYTEKNEELKKKTTEVFDPILFSFEDEIETALSFLEEKIKTEHIEETDDLARKEEEL